MNSFFITTSVFVALCMAKWTDPNPLLHVPETFYINSLVKNWNEKRKKIVHKNVGQGMKYYDTFQDVNIGIIKTFAL